MNNSPSGALSSAVAASPTCAATSAIELQKISVRRGGREILRRVDADLQYGAVTGIVGPNGAGKSTMLAVMSGDIRPSLGTVRLKGADLSTLSSLQIARQRAVMVQQQRTGFAFTVAETLSMARTPWRGTPRQQDDAAAIERAVMITELEPLLHQEMPSLSGGEAQRAALARTVAQDTDILLLDEPIAAMDVRFQELTMKMVRQRADHGAAICVVLHDLTVAAAYCDRLIVVADGHIAVEGPTDEVLQPRLLTEVYQVPIEVVRHGGRTFVAPVRA